MRHIALLSVLCISVSTAALNTSALAASQPDLKDRLAAARVAAQQKNGSDLVVPPESAVSRISDDTIKQEKATLKTDATGSMKPLTEIDMLPKPGTNVPLVSSPIIAKAADGTIVPVSEPVKAQVKKTETVKTAEKISAPSPKPTTTKIAPVTTAVPPVAAPIVTAADIQWDQQAVKAQPKAIAPTKPINTVSNEAVIPAEKLQPVVLPSVITPTKVVTAKPVQEKAIAPVVAKATPTPKAVTPVTEKTVTKTEDVKTAAITPAPQLQPITEKPVTAKPVAKSAEKTAEKTAKNTSVKQVTKSAEKTTAVATKEKPPEFLPMPKAMPAMAPKVIDTTKVSVTASASSVPAVPVIPAAAKNTPQIPASSPSEAWSIRLMGSTSDKDNAFCLMENKFNNHASLMVGQRADGYSTIGINYGVDMLDTGRHYSTLVKLDNSFEENFNGYAESGRMMIVQLGKKPSFFAQLAHSQSLQVTLPGVASNFAVQGVNIALQDFGNCLASIGGTLPTGAPATTIAQGQNMPVVPNMAVQSSDLGNTGTTGGSVAAIAPVAVAAAVTSAPVASQPSGSPWSNGVITALNQANIRPANIQQSAAVIEWAENNGMHGQIWQVAGNDILETTLDQLDNAEKECQGKFSSQIGAPESAGKNTVQLMESKCTTAQGMSISTWIVQQNPTGITVWEMRAPQTQNDASFGIRQRILVALGSQ